MIWTQKGFQCSKCGNVTHAKPDIQTIKQKETDASDFIYVSGRPRNNSVKVQRECPQCGNKEAFNWLSGISGEHAGIGRERTVEHFRCTKCSHTWAES